MSDLTDLRKRAQQQAQTGNYWAGKVVGQEPMTPAERAAIYGTDTP